MKIASVRRTSLLWWSGPNTFWRKLWYRWWAPWACWATHSPSLSSTGITLLSVIISYDDFAKCVWLWDSCDHFKMSLEYTFHILNWWVNLWKKLIFKHQISLWILYFKCHMFLADYEHATCDTWPNLMLCKLNGRYWVYWLLQNVNFGSDIFSDLA